MSGEVRRWELTKVSDDEADMAEDSEGAYVAWSDYADLLARYEALLSAARAYRADHVPFAASCDLQSAKLQRALDRTMQDNGGG